MPVTIELMDRERWQRLSSSFLDYNYRQLWDFGTACAERLGAASEHVAVYDGSKLMGLADVRVKRIPLFGSGIAYINGGPMVRRTDKAVDESIRLKTVLAELKDVYVRQKKYVLRIQPALGTELWNDQMSRIFQNLGFSVSDKTGAYRTIVLDITASQEDIRKQLNQKWRNCLNNSEKRGLMVKSGTTAEFFSVFNDLYKTLIDRKDFDVDMTPSFYAQVQEYMSETERFVVTLVYDNDQPVAGHVASILADTCVYLLGATHEAGLKNKAAYLAQWSVIRNAKEKGCHFYDLGGIDPDKNPGVYHFKKGLGGVERVVPGPFEASPDWLRRFLVNVGEKGYRLYRNLR